MSERFKIAAGLALILIAAAWAGTSDYQEAKRQEAVYCGNTESGAWPDYKGNAEVICGRFEGTTGKQP